MRKIKIFIFLLISLFPLSAQVMNDAQIIPSNHWIYDYFNKLEIESGISLFTDNVPMSVSEAKFNLNKIDQENLSSSEKTIYNSIQDFLYEKDSLLRNDSFSADSEIKITAEGYYKTNDSIPWDFNYNYDGPAVSIPIRFSFADVISLETNVICEKNLFAAQKASNSTNIPIDFNDLRFQFPDYAYGSFVKIFNDWGFSYQIGKQGRQIGYTETGSIIYNDTFETDMYSSLNLFNKDFKYTLDVSQVSYDQFLYMHQVQGIFFDKLKLSYLQAAMINDSFSLRQINPMMIMHSFMGNFENCEEWESYYYNESDVCAYLSLSFDWHPKQRLRLYGAYVQTEIQVPSEQHDEFIALPNGFGSQIGATWLIPKGTESLYKLNLEGIYTTPFLYIKQTPRTSLCRLRYYNEMPGLNPFEPVATWIGTPYGPDCFAINGSVEYEVTRKWSIKCNYLFKIHGDNYADMLNYRNPESPNYTWVEIDDGKDSDGNKINPRKVKIYNYYPFAKYKLSNDSDKTSIIEEATNLWMSGIPEYMNQISVSASCIINNNWSASCFFAYDLIFNCNNILNNSQSGIEAIFSCSYRL